MMVVEDIGSPTAAGGGLQDSPSPGTPELRSDGRSTLRSRRSSKFLFPDAKDLLTEMHPPTASGRSAIVELLATAEEKTRAVLAVSTKNRSGYVTPTDSPLRQADDSGDNHLALVVENQSLKMQVLEQTEMAQNKDEALARLSAAYAALEGESVEMKKQLTTAQRREEELLKALRDADESAQRLGAQVRLLSEANSGLGQLAQQTSEKTVQQNQLLLDERDALLAEKRELERRVAEQKESLDAFMKASNDGGVDDAVLQRYRKASTELDDTGAKLTQLRSEHEVALRNHRRDAEELEELRASYVTLQAEHAALQGSFAFQSREREAHEKEIARLRAAAPATPGDAHRGVKLPPLEVGGGPGGGDDHRYHHHHQHSSSKAESLARSIEKEVRKRQMQAMRNVDQLKSSYNADLFSYELEALRRRKTGQSGY